MMFHSGEDKYVDAATGDTVVVFLKGNGNI